MIRTPSLRIVVNHFHPTIRATRCTHVAAIKMLLIKKDDWDEPSRLKYNRLREAPFSAAWSDPEKQEEQIHKIHVYPARFPAFIVEQALQYASDRGIKVSRIGDVFCGSGTVTYEAAARNLEFWGCDINPVATLIARVKGSRVQPPRFRELAAAIVAAFDSASGAPDLSAEAITRLSPWYRPGQFRDLAKLRNAIRSAVDDGDDAREAFDCAFSAIL